MQKKYEIIDRVGVLYRIRAIRGIPEIGVKEGEVGGLIADERNLSQEGRAWVFNDAKVIENANVFGNAVIFGHACVRENAIVHSNALVHGFCEIRGNAMIYENASVHVSAIISGNAIIHGDANVHGNASVSGDARIRDNAQVYGNTVISDNAEIFGFAEVTGKTVIAGRAEISGNAVVKSMKDFIVFKNWWSDGRFFTWTRSDNMWRVGCFHGTGKELVEEEKKSSEISAREYSRVVEYVDKIIGFADDETEKKGKKQ